MEHFGGVFRSLFKSAEEVRLRECGSGEKRAKVDGLGSYLLSKMADFIAD